MAQKKDEFEISREALLQEQTSYVSSLYSPSQFIPYNPNNLYRAKSNYDIYEEMRLDEQVKASLTLKKNIVLSKGWEIRLEEDGEQYEEEKNFLEENLKYWLDTAFDQVLLEILSALDYGFSLSEIVYEIWKDRLIIKDVKTRPPHGFLFYQDDFGNITKVTQRQRSLSEIELNPDKFIHFIYQKEFQNPYGKSDLESAYRAWWSKDVIIKFWNIYLERNAVPPTIGQYPKSANASLRARFLTLLDNLQNKSSMVLPDDFKVTLLEASRSSTPDFEKAIDKYNLIISRSLLMPDLLGMSGSQTEGGSYSLGQKHFDIFMLVIEKIQRDLERVINNSLVRPFFKLNFGIEENYPKFSLIKHSDKNQKELSDLWIKAVQTGVIEATIEEKSHFRDVVGYPENPNDNAKPNQNPFGQFPKKEESKEEFRNALYDANDFNRPLNDIEKKYSSILKNQKKMIEKNEEKYFEVLSPIMGKMIEGLISEVKDRNLIERQNVGSLENLKIKYKNEFRNALTAMLKDIGNMALEQSDQMLSKTKKMAKPLTPKKVLELFEQQAFWIAGVESDEMLKLAKGIILNGISEGKTTRDTAFELSKVLEDFPKSRLKTIVRTNITKAFSQAALSSFRDPDVKDIMQGVEFSAVLDDSTTDQCFSLDGKQYKIDDPYLDIVTPPLHFNCRSTLIPITIEDEFSESEKVKLKPIDENEPFGFYELDE